MREREREGGGGKEREREREREGAVAQQHMFQTSFLMIHDRPTKLRL